MKKFKVAVLLGLLLACMNLNGCSVETVPAGNVGIKVNLYGDSKGVQQEALNVGRYFLTWNEQIYLFPTFNQLHSYNSPFIFQTSDAMTVQAKIGIEYRVKPEMTATVFQTYRKGVDEITATNVRQNISDSLIKHASKMDVNRLTTSGKTDLLDEVTKDLKAKLDPIGIEIVKVSWTSDMQYPQQVRDSINAKIEATQRALLRENEIAQSKAEAQKLIEAARGKAESIKIEAQAEADAIALKAKALRDNPEVVQLEAINKWNGVMPQFMSADAPMPFVQTK